MAPTLMVGTSWAAAGAARSARASSTTSHACRMFCIPFRGGGRRPPDPVPARRSNGRGPQALTPRGRPWPGPARVRRGGENLVPERPRVEVGLDGPPAVGQPLGFKHEKPDDDEAKNGE